MKNMKNREATQMAMPRPQTEYMNNSKIANYISTQSGLLSKTMQLTTIPKKNIFVTVDLSADKNLSVSNTNITPYDMAVMDSVYTMLVSGATTFTPEMIVRIMSGDFYQDVTKQKIETVKQSLQKLSLIRITIDCTDELRARGIIEKSDTARLTSYLMPIREIEIKSANHQHIMNGFRLLEIPVLYEYAASVKQIISIPTALLENKQQNGKNGLSNTEDVILLKRALIRRIEAIKNPHNNMNNTIIRYEWIDPVTQKQKGFLESLGYNENQYKNHQQWLKKRSSLHQAITTILTGFLEDNYIHGYEVMKEGKQKITGIQISV